MQALKKKFIFFWRQINRARGAFHIWGRSPAAAVFVALTVWFISLKEMRNLPPYFLDVAHGGSFRCVLQHPSACRSRRDRYSAVLEANDGVKCVGNEVESWSTSDGLSEGFLPFALIGPQGWFSLIWGIVKGCQIHDFSCVVDFQSQGRHSSRRLVWLIKYLCCISEQEGGL